MKKSHLSQATPFTLFYYYYTVGWDKSVCSPLQWFIEPTRAWSLCWQLLLAILKNLIVNKLLILDSMRDSESNVSIVMLETTV